MTVDKTLKSGRAWHGAVPFMEPTVLSHHRCNRKHSLGAGCLVLRSLWQKLYYLDWNTVYVLCQLKGRELCSRKSLLLLAADLLPARHGSLITTHRPHQRS